MIEILKPSQYDTARAVGKLVGTILQTLKSRCKPGVNLLDIDRWTKEMIEAAGATSCYVDYAPEFGEGPFGHYICTAVNDAVLHAKPTDYKLANGDLLSLDLAVILDGLAADSAISFIVGETVRLNDEKLIATTQIALQAGIDQVKPGAKIGDIAHAIGTVLTGQGYPVNLEFGGHGIGSTMHQDPHIPNHGRAGRGYKLRPGLMIAIEPWVMEDTDELIIDKDGWTLRSETGCQTAHSEHTVLVTENGVEVLTLVPEDSRF